MSDLKNILRDIGYFGVGAAAVILEAGGKAVKSLVRKGEKVLTDNQDTVDELKEKAKAAGERIKAAVKDLTEKPEPTVEATPVAEEPVVDEPAAEEPIVDEPVVDEPTAEDPFVPDAIYRSGEPVEAEEAPAEDESPEETING